MIDPNNPETVYVASPGHLFGPNPERGIFKTTDGGKTWNKIKFIDKDTGFTDIAIDPIEHQHALRGELPAAAQRLLLQRRRPGERGLEDDRRGQDLDEADRNGLPPGTYGRIALGVVASNPNVVYVQIEAGEVGQPSDAARRSNAATRPRRQAQRPCRRRRAPAAAAGRGRRAARSRRRLRRQPRGGGGGGRGQFDWCNNGGPNKGFPAAAARGQQAAQRRDAARARSGAVESSARRTRARAGRS